MEVLANKLGITNAHQLAIAEDRLSRHAVVGMLLFFKVKRR